MTVGGVYRLLVVFLMGCVLVSCDWGVGDVILGGYDYDLCEFDPSTGVLCDLGGVFGCVDIEVVPIFVRAEWEIFTFCIDEVNGNIMVIVGDPMVEVEVFDFPLFEMLFFQNIR